MMAERYGMGMRGIEFLRGEHVESERVHRSWEMYRWTHWLEEACAVLWSC